MLTAKKLRSVLHYDPETGVFTWLVAHGKMRVGSVAGRLLQSTNARQIQIEGHRDLGGRLAWLYMHGRWPIGQIDHINRVRSDDRLSNLREVTAAQNCANRIHKSTKGLRGTAFNRAANKWQAQIGVNGKRIYLGLFNTQQDAYIAYCHAAEQYHGEYRPIR